MWEKSIKEWNAQPKHLDAVSKLIVVSRVCTCTYHRCDTYAVMLPPVSAARWYLGNPMYVQPPPCRTLH